MNQKGHEIPHFRMAYRVKMVIEDDIAVKHSEVPPATWRDDYHHVKKGTMDR